MGKGGRGAPAQVGWVARAAFGAGEDVYYPREMQAGRLAGGGGLGGAGALEEGEEVAHEPDPGVEADCGVFLEAFGGVYVRARVLLACDHIYISTCLSPPNLTCKWGYMVLTRLIQPNNPRRQKQQIDHPLLPNNPVTDLIHRLEQRQVRLDKYKLPARTGLCQFCGDLGAGGGVAPEEVDFGVGRVLGQLAEGGEADSAGRAGEDGDEAGGELGEVGVRGADGGEGDHGAGIGRVC